jgi:hypothetical protein
VNPERSPEPAPSEAWVNLRVSSLTAPKVEKISDLGMLTQLKGGGRFAFKSIADPEAELVENCEYSPYLQQIFPQLAISYL